MSDDDITPQKYETLLLQLMFRDKDVQGKILPFLTPNVFEKFESKEVVKHIIKHHEKYNMFPTIPELKLKIENKDTYKYLIGMLNSTSDEVYDDQFVKDEVEGFFRDKLLHNELFVTLEGIKNDDDAIKSSAPDRMRDANSFCFDTSIGLDFFEDGEKLFESLHEKDIVIPSGIKGLDGLIGGGFHEKTLSLFLAPTAKGKSLIKGSICVNSLIQNKNVLYITLEMSEKKVSERITSNIFDVSLDDLYTIPKDRFLNTFDKVKNRIKKQLIIKEYPPRSMNTNRLRNLLKELELKNKFVPDIIYVDYLGIMIANQNNKNNNTNTEMKIISEELRGLAVEQSLPIVSSVQTNRGGYNEIDLEITDIAESFGTTNTADLIISVVQSEEMKTAGRYVFILSKNRHGIDKVQIMVGVDYKKMRLYDVDEDNENNNNINTSHGKPITPPGTTSTEIVDEAAVKVLKTMKNNKITNKNKIFKGTDIKM